MNERLAQTAREEALKSYHGYVAGTESNLHPLVAYFPQWDMRNWDAHWCAAFVYHCCRLSGIELPVRYPDDRVTCNFAGCIAWEQWAQLETVKRWREFGDGIEPQPGDIILFDSVFDGVVHDHIGILLEEQEDGVLLAEGNFNNVSAIVRRKKDKHLRGFIWMNDIS